MWTMSSSAKATLRDAPDAAALVALSARVGADPLLVQGPGGNTSLKQDGVMWVKASGAALADAARRDIFVPLDVAALRAALANDDPACETSLAFVPARLNASGLRPSIEATMHALLPQRIVVHVHCVATIAAAIRAEPLPFLQEHLAGLDWIFVPYRRPGLPLTQAIRERLQPETRVLVLGNHGLVVAGDSVGDCAALLTDVQARLERAARDGAAQPALPASIAPLDTAALSGLARGTDYAPADDPAVHALALRPNRLAQAASGSLYPDHVIFLGPSVEVLKPGETLARKLALARPGPQRLVLVPDRGALMPRAASRTARAMARCLADVLARAAPGMEPNTLSTEDEAALLNWDAEKYRQSRNRDSTQ